MLLIQLAERRLLPDELIRMGIRRLLRQRLQREQQRVGPDRSLAVDRFADELRASPVTVCADRANEQHYEVPAAFFAMTLGEHLKYSCGWWDDAVHTLDEAEAAMLRLTCERAELQDGMEIMDLGCGWGSLSLWIAQEYPGCRILALSNSATQREYIMRCCRERGYRNIEVVCEDIAHFKTTRQFDRVVSVEMFEHVRNYQALLARIAGWLTHSGKLFVHIFCHRHYGYPFEDRGHRDWMSRNFFSGGIMPARDLFSRFQLDLVLKRCWWLNGSHYAKTCEAWLARLDANPQEAVTLLAESAVRDARRDVQRWRMFFMACAELFRYGDGREWGVGHYLFQRRADLDGPPMSAVKD